MTHVSHLLPKEKFGLKPKVYQSFHQGQQFNDNSLEMLEVYQMDIIVIVYRWWSSDFYVGQTFTSKYSY